MHLPVALAPQHRVFAVLHTCFSSLVAVRQLSSSSSSSSSAQSSRGVRIASVRVASLRVLQDAAAHMSYDTRVLTAHDLSRPSTVSDVLFSGERQGMGDLRLAFPHASHPLAHVDRPRKVCIASRVQFSWFDSQICICSTPWLPLGLARCRRIAMLPRYCYPPARLNQGHHIHNCQSATRSLEPTAPHRLH